MTTERQRHEGPTLEAVWPLVLDRVRPWVLEERETELRRILDGEPESLDAPAVRGFGDRRVGAINETDLQTFVAAVRDSVGHAVIRRVEGSGAALMSYEPDDNGRGAARNLAEAIRAVFRVLHEEGVLVVNPAATLKGPPGNIDARSPLTGQQINNFHTFLDDWSFDPKLDHAWSDYLLRTAFRAEGLEMARVGYLDPRGCYVRAPQKYAQVHSRPVARSAILAWRALAAERGASRPMDRLFITLRGNPVSHRRLDRVFGEAQRAGVWGADLPVTAHWFRHTVIDTIRVGFGLDLAFGWAGHSRRGLGALGHYVRDVSPSELRPVAEGLFGPLEDCPLPD